MSDFILMLLLRFLFLLGIFALEILGASIWLDTAELSRTSGLTGFVGDFAPLAVRSLFASTAIFATIAYLKRGLAFQQISAKLSETPIRWHGLVGHLGLMAGFTALSAPLFGGKLPGSSADMVMAIWLVVGLSAISLAAFAVMPPRLWLKLVWSTGWLWAYAVAAGVLVWLAASANRPLWKISTALTLRLVKFLLHPFLPQVFADPASASIGSPRFSVSISAACSGVEGAGLMVVFGILWLWFFRKECRFPQTLIVIPAGVAILWLLNALRIAALILIGNAGAPDIALGGFHSQAGWMAFNVVALGFVVTVQRLPWISARQAERELSSERKANPATPYLMPFLLILAAAMISRSLSAGFEWLYPLRFFAAGAALWFFRRRYAQLGWSFSWAGPVIGVVVFAIWMLLDRGTSAVQGNSIAVGMAALPAGSRFAWLAFRTLAAVTTVPIAEELAFRAFLIRRLVSADFESLSVKSFSWVSLLISSVAFGLLHGDRWLAGTLAGLLYSRAFLRGKFGGAVIAHATTNTLLAGLVLHSGRWDLW